MSIFPLSTAELDQVRREFPALRETVHGKPLVYLDNAATTHKPLSVLAEMEEFYLHKNANVHRGIHELSLRATEAYEGAREKLRCFVNANSTQEIIFTKGCTEAINLVAGSWGRANLKAGDEVLVSVMEHHSNIVPWQLSCEASGATIRPIPITDRGEIDLLAFEKLLSPKVKLVAVGHISNALGTINPLESIIKLAHQHGAVVLADGAQSGAHCSIDVQKLDVDFYCLSGHKLYGPTGTGVLYGKQPLLEAMPPYQGGGDMIRTVAFERTTYDELPRKFEAGTPNIAGAIGLGAAVDFLLTHGVERFAAHERHLLGLVQEQLLQIPEINIIGTSNSKTGIVSFVINGIHPHDIGTVLDHEGVAIRTGHHCCMPLMTRFAIPGTARASFACYNTTDEIHLFVQALKKVLEVFHER